MFRFSVDKDSAKRANKKQLASNDVGPDEDWEQGLRDTDAHNENESYFRAETASPASVEDAISFVQGLFFTTPERVWIGDELFEVDEEMANRPRKSTA